MLNPATEEQPDGTGDDKVRKRQMSQTATDQRTVRQALTEVYNHRELQVNLIRRELRSRFRRTFLGWGWSFVQPVMMTAIYALVLGTFLSARPGPGDPSGIDSFALFLLAGLVPWGFFAGGVSGAIGSISNAGGLITRVWFPRELLPISAILALAFTMLIEFLVLALAVMLIGQVMMLQYLPIALGLMVLQTFFTLGFAFFLSAANVRFKDVEYLTTVFLLAYFYLTPILYPVQFIPDSKVFGTSFTWQDVALANPLARFMQAYRNVFYDLRLPGFETTMWLIVWSFGIFFLGLRFFVRRADRFAESM